jgi:hypothetical protein
MHGGGEVSESEMKRMEGAHHIIAWGELFNQKWREFGTLLEMSKGQN